MKTLLKVLQLILAIIAPSLSYGKTHEFLYDASGNRVRRQFVINTRSLPEDEDTRQAEADEMFQDLVAQKTIRIHPNPTIYPGGSFYNSRNEIHSKYGNNI